MRLIGLPAAALPVDTANPGLAGSEIARAILGPILQHVILDLDDKGKAELMQGALAAVAGMVLAELGEEKAIEFIQKLPGVMSATAAAWRHGMN